jgi:hypothetical protein
MKKEELSESAQAILKLFQAGDDAKVISEKLNIKRTTVYWHIRNLRSEGLLPPPPAGTLPKAKRQVDMIVTQFCDSLQARKLAMDERRREIKQELRDLDKEQQEIDEYLGLFTNENK